MTSGQLSAHRALERDSARAWSLPVRRISRIMPEGMGPEQYPTNTVAPKCERATGELRSTSSGCDGDKFVARTHELHICGALLETR